MQMLDDKEAKLIEDIEEYYLSVITRYLGADPKGLIQHLENHNRSWNQWYPKLKKSGKKFFNTGAERVVYMLLNRGDILGDPSSNPLGSDNSFLKYDRYFEKNLAINIDVKTVKANENIGDIIGNSPIGINQNSYKSNIEYFTKNELVELRGYNPGLEAKYHIEGNDYLNITYSIVILYCELPTDTKKPNEQRVIAIITNCIPNGELYELYKDKVFSPGKTDDLCIKIGQKIDIGSGKIITTDGSEKPKDFKINGSKMSYLYSKESKNQLCLFEKYRELNGMNKIQWHLDARFNYKDIVFSTLEKERRSRVKKIFLDPSLFEDFFYFVSKNKRRKKRIGRLKKTEENFLFLQKLKLF